MGYATTWSPRRAAGPRGGGGPSGRAAAPSTSSLGHSKSHCTATAMCLGASTPQHCGPFRTSTLNEASVYRSGDGGGCLPVADPPPPGGSVLGLGPAAPGQFPLENGHFGPCTFSTWISFPGHMTIWPSSADRYSAGETFGICRNAESCAGHLGGPSSAPAPPW